MLTLKQRKKRFFWCHKNAELKTGLNRQFRLQFFPKRYCGIIRILFLFIVHVAHNHCYNHRNQKNGIAMTISAHLCTMTWGKNIHVIKTIQCTKIKKLNDQCYPNTLNQLYMASYNAMTNILAIDDYILLQENKSQQY